MADPVDGQTVGAQGHMDGVHVPGNGAAGPGEAEYVEHEGRVYEVVKDRPRGPEFTQGQLAQIGEVYVKMAKELPTEGRDYVVSFRFPSPKAGPTVSMRWMTDLGRAYVEHLAKVFAKQKKEQER